MQTSSLIPLIALLLAACGGSTAVSTTGDAGASAPPAGSSKNTIACGETTCSAAGDICCNDYSPGSALQCVKSCNLGDAFACDGREDCIAARCCAAATPFGTRATCQPRCLAGRDFQLCHQDDDCTDAPGDSRKCCPIDEAVYPGLRWCDVDCR